MRMLEDMDRRLLNWARWVLMTKGGGRMAAPSFEARVDGEGWDAPTVIPTNDAEAEETHAGVMTMPSEQRAAVENWYVGTGGVASKARRLCISETTLRERVGMAQRRLNAWLTDKRQAAQQERERNEKLQRAAIAR